MDRNEVTPLVVQPHPFTPEGRTFTVAAFLMGETLGAYVERNGIALPRSEFRVLHNGCVVPHHLWQRLIPRTGDQIVIHAMAHGGGGGGKVLRSVAMIALVVASITIPGAGIAGLYSGFGLTGTSLALASAGIMIGGSMLINALLPPPAPPDLGSDSKYGSSPTYQLSGGRNRLRPWEPMTLIFGRHKVVPDLGATPYSDWAGADQYFNQVFHFGLQGGEIEFSDFKIGQTPVLNYSGVSIVQSDASGSLPGFAENVVTLQGFEAKQYVVNSRTTPERTTRIVINLAAVAFLTKGNGDGRYRTASWTARYRLVGGADWITESGSAANDRPVTMYRTVAWNVPEGQYEVEFTKTSEDMEGNEPDEDNDVSVNKITVSQIQCMQPPGAVSYEGQQRVGMRIKASGQLNGIVDEFSAVAFAKCPAWNGSAWVVTTTRNPAWWFLWFARGKTVAGRGRIYGAGMADAQIDIDAIKAWAAWCDAKQLTFDYVLDRKVSCAQMLQTIARAGRASPTWQTGKLGVVWDVANQPVSAMFGPFNIKAGSFRIDYVNGDTPDEIILNFANEENGYQMDEVRVAVPGAATTNNPLQLDLDGCTVKDMAGREANLIAASQVWHRRRTTWETDIEGWVASRGDVVQISHDLTVWGYSGRLVGRSGNQIALSQSIPIGSGTMMLRDPEGNMKTVSVVGATEETDLVTITTDMTGFPLPGDAGFEDVPALDWAWFFDPLATPGRRFKIVDVQPAEDGVRFQAVDDDPEYYASETDPYDYTPPRDGSLLMGIVFGVNVSESIVNIVADLNLVQISWAISAPMPAEVVISVNGQAQSAQRVIDNRTSIQAQTGDVLDITVTPISVNGRGQPYSRSYIVQGLRSALPAVTGLTSVFRDGLTVLTWNRVTDVRQPDYEIRIGESWANSRTVAVTPMLESLTAGNGLYWVAARYVYKGQAIYGPPDSLLVSGAVLVRNVLLTEVEDPQWDGALTEGAYAWDGLLTLVGAGDVLAETDILAVRDVLWLGGAQPRGVYTSAQTVDIGFVAPVRLDFHIDAYALNFGEDVLGMADVLSSPDILNASNAQHWKATPQYRTAGDDGIYGPWINYTPGLVNIRYIQVRIVIETDEPLIVPFVEHFTWIVDVPDLTQKAEGITVPTTGLRIEYEKIFHAVPNVQIALFDAVDGDRYVLTNSDETGFDIQILNASTPKAAVINWLSQGY
ncbi:TipJ family phage tail tip protein [Castellaniella sp. WN]